MFSVLRQIWHPARLSRNYIIRSYAELTQHFISSHNSHWNVLSCCRISSSKDQRSVRELSQIRNTGGEFGVTEYAQTPRVASYDASRYTTSPLLPTSSASQEAVAPSPETPSLTKATLAALRRQTALLVHSPTPPARRLWRPLQPTPRDIVISH